MSIQEEFRIRNVLPSHPDLHTFTSSKWMPTGAYLAYRWLLALYISVDVIVDRLFFKRWYSFAFTFWGLITLTLYLNLAAILTTIKYVKTRLNLSDHAGIVSQSGEEGISTPGAAEDETFTPDGYMPKLYKLMWLLFNVCAVNSVIVSVGYWGLLHQKFGRQATIGLIGYLNINSHLINAVIMILDSMIHNVPVRIFHVVYSTIYGLIYFFTTIIVWLASGRVAYFFLDYSKRPGIAAIVIVGGCFVVQPLIQLMHYGLYRARIWLQGVLLDGTSVRGGGEVTALHMQSVA
ncbi:predicted protein [Nematostella vectensis]|uniref:Protein rolling stone n=1 Tax=Nematostella vectensis TaxID=45351 RepID=A7S7Z4_NEMVE|nr:predicted protein [Nematostella vectensis]|eukprot:XP_001632223.1 predicted protein [Nematostella vectensis]